jgi:hypothetical protein
VSCGLVMGLRGPHGDSLLIPAAKYDWLSGVDILLPSALRAEEVSFDQRGFCDEEREGEAVVGG